VIKLTRSDPSKNMHRFYALQLAPTLFGEWVLVAEWGRIGSPGTVRQKVFHSADSAHEALTKCQTIKIRRGYRTTNPMARASAYEGTRDQ
jgi:predicted DNA-binding WGR domain protein